MTGDSLRREAVDVLTDAIDLILDDNVIEPDEMQTLRMIIVLATDPWWTIVYDIRHNYLIFNLRKKWLSESFFLSHSIRYLCFRFCDKSLTWSSLIVIPSPILFLILLPLGCG